ncbi:MAG: tetratricopeptide repeat protein [Gemmatimonadetes bacterium]|nr:tetratricopeptide repeat protein [Gemmatimonadota bacterium]
MSRMTKEELRHDSFVEGTARVTHYVQQNFMTVLLGLAVVAALVVGGVFMKQSRERSRAQASQLMHQATSLYGSGAYSDGLLKLDDLVSRYGGTPEGKAAVYFAGASHLALGENDAAIERFREYLANEPEGTYVNSARAGLGLALEGRGDLADAAQAFRELRESLEPEESFYAQAAFGEARALRGLGQLDAAIQVLEPLTAAQDFSIRQDAEAKIAVLKAMAQTSAL